jgi:hypothetical protein
MKKKCADCGHDYSEHCPDVSYPDALRCFHGAGDGTGCREVYDERCRQYVDPEETK